MPGPPVEVLLLDLAVVLLAARLLGGVAERLRQPRVIGEIGAGVVLGPTVLGSTWSARVIAPEALPLLTTIGSLGLILYMFVIAGRAVHAFPRPALAVSAGSFLLPLALGAGLGAVLSGRHAGSSAPAFVVFVGLAFCATAVPVLIRILDERGLTRTPTGEIALASATGIDLTVWALLATLGLFTGWDRGSPWLVALAPLYAAAMFLVVRPLLGRLLRAARAGGGTPMPAGWTLVALVGGLLLSAAVAEALHLHFVVGAILFGAVIPREGPERLPAAIGAALEPIGRSLFLPVYFVVTGIQLDLRAIDIRGAGELVAVLAVAIAGKLAGTYLGARAAHLPARTSATLAVLMNTRGLTELIILGIGRDLGVLDDSMYAIMVVMSLVTTAMTGPLLDLLQRTPGPDAVPPPSPTPRPEPAHPVPAAAAALPATAPTGSAAAADAVPVPLPVPATGGLPADPDWFKRAVFYEVLVRSFADSDGDGTGDLPGLTGKLDYLQWLGVDCLWLPPFFDSPLEDGGYDIRDYRRILPAFGTIEDFLELLRQSHSRGIRVIIDLVVNHTSDTHPWFVSSRTDPDGPFGDFYVWADDDSGYPQARVIFIDTESSNWSFDPVRKQYFWHRFFSHQPDLNYDNPAVQEAMVDVLRFWLDLGVDGFRLDAVPYLFEREGTNGENLPETHQFLRRCRKIMDDEYPGRILLAEANQWPAEVVDYFGDPSTGGDECHMAFHFPLMPRIFMAAHRGSRLPIAEILAATPSLPENCQWGIFLRNHDELTLEMVANEERDYMWSAFTTDPRMRANLGIRRRLAPLLDNDRDQLRLFTALLLSLPGSPVLYYGDEIGMGDNIWLGDRDGVRTPMQWTPDRNAGFSAGDPGRLFLPVIMDPVYGHQAINVEAQRSSPASMLCWTRRMIAVRREHPAFALGSFQECGAVNPATLAYVREHVDGSGRRDTILCLSNLSRRPQPVEIDLRVWTGCVLRELTGGVVFGRIGAEPCRLALPGHGFLWFSIEPG